MCSPLVAKVVSERLKTEGKQPKISRRNFLRAGGTLAVAGLIGTPTHLQRVRAQEMMGQVIDLTHVFGESVPTYLPDALPTSEVVVSVENDGFYIRQWTWGEHTGTHVDAPAHFSADGETIDNYPAEYLVSPAVVIDIASKAEENADAMLTVEDIMAWESENGEIPPGALVCMYSGWDERWSDIASFRNADDDGVMHFPGFSGDAAAFLLEERDIHGIGVDTLSLDIGSSSTFDVHLSILPAGKYGIENIANLAMIKDTMAQVVVGVPRWGQGSGGPCRLLALV